MLFPCWKFEYALGFLRASHACIYGVKSHIYDQNPRGTHSQFRLPPRIVRELRLGTFSIWYANIVTEHLNAARGRLRTLLHHWIWEPARGLMDIPCPWDTKQLPSGARPPHTCDLEALAPCPCRLATVGGYVRALEQTEAWPLDDTWTKESTNTILARLEDFGYNRKATDCGECDQDFGGGVATTVRMVRDYFDGLCLDCMQETETRKEKIETRKQMRSNARAKLGELRVQLRRILLSRDSEQK